MASISRETSEHLLRASNSATPGSANHQARTESCSCRPEENFNQATELEIAPHVAFQKYNVTEESRDHHQRRIASVRHESQYGVNA
jgi:hypothetical protein